MKIIAFSLFVSLLMAAVSYADENSFPKINLSGNKSYFTANLSVNPDKAYFGAIKDSDFIPMVSNGGPWQEQLTLRISSRLNDDWDVDYELNQFPGAGDLFDLNVGYKNFSLLFGSQKNALDNRDFVSPARLNGIGVGSKWGKIKADIFTGNYLSPSNPTSLESISSAKLFRDPRYKGKLGGSFNVDNPYFTYYGFKLEQVDFPAEGLKVYADRRLLLENTDYFTDRQDGLLLVNGRFMAAKEIRVESDQQKLAFDPQRAKRRAFYSPDQRILEESEVLKVDNLPMIRGLDYRINYATGLIIMNEPVRDDAEVRIDYNYFGGYNSATNEVTQNVSGANVEYALTDNSCLGVTVLSITPQNNAGLSNLISSQIANFYVETYINKDTCLKGELALSNLNPNYHATGSQEADNAVNLVAKTKLWGVAWTADYRRTGLNFATANRMVAGQKWGEERWDLIAAPAPFCGVFAKVGYGQGRDSVTSLETSVTERIISLDWRPIEFLSIGGEERNKNNKDELIDVSANVNSTLIYVKYDLPAIPLLSPNSLTSNAFIKGTRIVTDNNILPGMVISGRSEYSGREYGLWLNLKGWLLPFSFCYLSYKTESGDPAIDLTAVSTGAADRVIPYVKLAYETTILGNNIQFYMDYSTVTQTGTIAYRKTIDGIGFLWETPIDNPVLSKVQVGGDLTTTNYKEDGNSNDDYNFSQFTFHGTLVF